MLNSKMKKKNDKITVYIYKVFGVLYSHLTKSK